MGALAGTLVSGDVEESSELGSIGGISFARGTAMVLRNREALRDMQAD
jgi:hypothetical protein